MLTSKQRAHLQGLAHDKKPVVLIGNKGLTAAVLKEVEAALLAHELIKVKLGEPDPESGDLDAGAKELAAQARAELVARLGRMALLYKRHPDKPRIALPRAKEKKGLFDVTQ